MTSVKAPTTEDRNPIRRIPEIYEEKRGVGQPVISIELFPPKTPRAADSLFEKALPRLATAKPDFFSVTYGAGGGTRDKTLEVVNHIQNHHGITGMAHLTCLGSTKDEVARFLTDASNLDILNILALRGDPPRGLPDAVPPDDGFEYSFQLIDFIQSHGNFSIGAAGFPECHVACTEGRHVGVTYEVSGAFRLESGVELSAGPTTTGPPPSMTVASSRTDTTAVPTTQPAVTSPLTLPPTTVPPTTTLGRATAARGRVDRGIGGATLGLGAVAVLALGAGVVAVRRRGSGGPEG